MRVLLHVSHYILIYSSVLHVLSLIIHVFTLDATHALRRAHNKRFFNRGILLSYTILSS